MKLFPGYTILLHHLIRDSYGSVCSFYTVHGNVVGNGQSIHCFMREIGKIVFICLCVTDTNEETILHLFIVPQPVRLNFRLKLHLFCYGMKDPVHITCPDVLLILRIQIDVRSNHLVFLPDGHSDISIIEFLELCCTYLCLLVFLWKITFDLFLHGINELSE